MWIRRVLVTQKGYKIWGMAVSVPEARDDQCIRSFHVIPLAFTDYYCVMRPVESTFPVRNILLALLDIHGFPAPNVHFRRLIFVFAILRT